MKFVHILLSPVVTEKSNAKQAKHVYTFLVHNKANKIEVAQAVAQAYGVTVKKVTIMNIRAKERLAGKGKLITKRHPGRKAFVTIDSKQSIDVNKFSKK